MTLILMIVAAVAGAWLGAGIVAKLAEAQDSDRAWARRCSSCGGALCLAQSARRLPAPPACVTGGTPGTLDLAGRKLVIGLVGNFVLGALMTLGIGMYAPCMILVGLLGMNAKAAFPIMMGSCAFLMPISSEQFVQKDAYSLRPAMALGARRPARRAHRRAHREGDGRDLRPLAGDRRRPHRRDDDAAVGGARGMNRQP